MTDVAARGAPTRSAFAGLVGTGGVVALGLRVGGLDLSFPLAGYAVLGLVVSLAALSIHRTAHPQAAFSVVSTLGMSLLTIFVVDADPVVPLAVFWPLWGLHAANTAYTLQTRHRVSAAIVGSTTLAVALVAIDASGSDIVLHLGAYLTLTLLVTGLARQHHLRAQQGRATAESVALRTNVLGTLARMNRLETDGLASAAVDGLAEVGYAMGTFGAVDRTTDMIHSIASVGFEPDAELDRPVPIDQGLAGEAFRQGRTVVIDDYQSWSGRIEQRETVGGAVGVPVIVDGHPAAVLLGARETPGRPDPAQLEMIEILAAQAARVLLNARRFDEEQHSARRLLELDQLEEDIVSTITHELRTPLTVIQGVTETLIGRQRELSTELSADLIARLVVQADRLDDLIATLLYVSRLEAGALDPRVRSTGVTEIVEHAGHLGSDGPAELHVEVAADAGVTCDPELIARVLDQLVSNARGHNPAGTDVTLRVVEDGDGIRFSVTDHGVGMDPEHARTLTRPFVRGGPSTRRASSGLGLGLAICDHLLRVHGSELTLRSAPGQGTTASFRLPRAASPDRDDHPPTTPAVLSDETRSRS